MVISTIFIIFLILFTIMSEESDEVFVYRGSETSVPDDVIHVRIHPSVTIIPRRAFGSQIEEAQELKRWQNAILRFAKIGVSRTNTIIFTVVSVHTFAKIGVGYPNCVIYIRISS